MDVKTFNKIYAEAQNIQKYFIMIFDMNIFNIWTSENADRKYHCFSIALNDLRQCGHAVIVNKFEDDYEFSEDHSSSICSLLKVICKAVFDQDISGFKDAHQIFDDSVLSGYRINATMSARNIADIIGLDEDEMINGLD